MAFDTIWKFRLAITDRQLINMPAEFSILSADVDPEGHVCIWAMVESGAATRNVEIRIIGIGRPIPTLGDFIGTVRDGPFMWHVFTGPGDGANRPVGGFHFQTRGRG